MDQVLARGSAYRLENSVNELPATEQHPALTRADPSPTLWASSDRGRTVIRCANARMTLATSVPFLAIYPDPGQRLVSKRSDHAQQDHRTVRIEVPHCPDADGGPWIATVSRAGYRGASRSPASWRTGARWRDIDANLTAACLDLPKRARRQITSRSCRSLGGELQGDAIAPMDQRPSPRVDEQSAPGCPGTPPLPRSLPPCCSGPG